VTGFRLRTLRVEGYRCFEALTFSLEDDTTVLFAENGGGKTALLTALAMGLAVFQKGSPKTLKLDVRRDPRMRILDDKGRREPTGPCTVTWSATAGEGESVEWSTTVQPASGRSTNRRRQILEAIEKVRVPGERWPLFAWYGVERMQRSLGRARPHERTHDRWEAYASSLDPRLDDTPLLQWLQDEMLGDVARQRQGEPQRFLDKAVMEATMRATPGVVNAWYDPVEQSPMVRFESGHVAPWSELSDGYHVFIALVVDIARRAVILNEIDGAEAPVRVEGVVLIDEIDLHLHPRWQRVALPRLRETFPRLQFVVSTHSPQVLSSAENRQVRRLVDGHLQEHDVFVEGRDSNAILRDVMNTDARDEKGKRALQELHDAIGRGARDDAEHLYRKLVGQWGDTDPELIRAKGFMDWND
jgi:predicted ATP-binding protein involved in virulence